MSDPDMTDRPAHPVLASAAEIKKRVQVLAARISADYAGREVDVVCLAHQAMMFTADLVRHSSVPVRQHVLAFSNYPNASASGEVRLTLDVAEPLEGRCVVLTEGMVISGRTPLYVMNLLRLRRPASLDLCVIGNKPSELAVDLPIKYRLFEFGNEWVAGYGMGKGRENTLENLVDLSA